MPGAIDPGETALILLKNAIRLLDQSIAPSEVKTQVGAAARELEEFLAGRSR